MNSSKDVEVSPVVGVQEDGVESAGHRSDAAARAAAPEYKTIAHLKRNRRARGGPDVFTLSVEIEVVTPIFGGAPQIRKIDDVEVIRSASIRGHLRFWWRALRGQDFSTPSALYQAESELWGKAAPKSGGGRSSVEIRVRVGPVLAGLDERNIERATEGAYALWPARQETGQNGRDLAPRRPPGTQFVLTLIGPSSREHELRNVVRAWLLFGGYGGRTRRGLGSLQVVKNAEEWLPKRATREALTGLFGTDVFANFTPARETPWLAGAALRVGGTGQATSAWCTALKWLEDFRQGSTDPAGSRAREPGPDNRPSISNWPEADKVRLLTTLHQGMQWAHPPRYTSLNRAWPRAGFGLPIMGQFQRYSRQGPRWDQLNPPKMEPGDFKLRWRSIRGEHDRLASPLIVKALPLANGTFVPCALWLTRAMPEGAEVGLAMMAGPNEIVDPHSTASFDTLVAAGDTALFAPLSSAATLREAFLGWLAPRSGVKAVA